MVEDFTGLGKAIEPVTTELAKHLGTFLEPIAKEAGELVGEWFKFRRIKRMLEVVQKAEKQLQDSGIQPKPVTDKILIPILEDASLEDNDNLTSKWAGLLASAAAGNEVPPSYSRILNELSPIEAKMLDVLYRANIDTGENFTVGELWRKVMEPGVLRRPAVVNLCRLGVCEVDASLIPEFNRSKGDYTSFEETRIQLTFLGYYFVAACAGPQHTATSTQGNAQNE